PSIAHFKPEGRAVAGGASDTEGESMLLQDRFGDGQAKPRPRLALVLAGPVIAVEYVGQVLRQNTGAVVLDLHAADAVSGGDAAQDEHAVGAHVMGGVAQKIVQNPLHHAGVSLNDALVVGLQLEGPAVLVADGVIAAGNLKAELAHVKG